MKSSEDFEMKSNFKEFLFHTRHSVRDTRTVREIWLSRELGCPSCLAGRLPSIFGRKNVQLYIVFCLFFYSLSRWQTDGAKPAVRQTGREKNFARTVRV